MKRYDPNHPAWWYWLLMALAGGCLLLTIGIGLLAGVASALPHQTDTWLSLRFLRPVHTLLALAWILFGTSSAVGLFTNENNRTDRWLASGQFGLFLVFLTGALISLMKGHYSGREYLSWPAVWSLPLLGAVTLSLVNVIYRWKTIYRHSAEAAWFLLVGMLLMPVSLVEAHLYLLGDIGVDPARDLAIQWHALDTFIAAWAINLYAVGMLLLPPSTKPMRASWLFVLAVIGILFDFGHHNYISPQAHLIKLVAFGATMLAVISFIRHLRTFRKVKIDESQTSRYFLKHVEFWTLFAVGSGVLMAIPWINLYVHGTYVVVGHTMGAMIGVNSVLILTAAGVFASGWSRIRPAMMRWTTWSLLFFCVALSGLGVARGLLRIDHYFLSWIDTLRPFYILIPITAVPLCVCLSLVGVDLLRSCAGVMNGEEAVEEETGPAVAFKS